MNQYVLSLEKEADLLSAYLNGASPMEASTKLNLSMLTVIRFYLIFDERY
jgi:hypothetical protein